MPGSLTYNQLFDEADNELGDPGFATDHLCAPSGGLVEDLHRGPVAADVARSVEDDRIATLSAELGLRVAMFVVVLHRKTDHNPFSLGFSEMRGDVRSGHES